MKAGGANDGECKLPRGIQAAELLALRVDRI
jgi:hypothetical protein